MVRSARRTWPTALIARRDSSEVEQLGPTRTAAETCRRLARMAIVPAMWAHGATALSMALLLCKQTSGRARFRDRGLVPAALQYRMAYRSRKHELQTLVQA